MSDIKISVARTNTTTYRAVLDEREIKRILANKVCGLACVASGADAVEVRIYLSSRMGSCGSEHSATVEVTIDHDKIASAGEA